MAMRISFNLAADKLKLPAGASLQDLIRLLSVRGALRGAVRRISPSSVFIAIQLEGRQTEVEIPLQGQALTPGQAVEISLEDEERIVLKVLTPAGQGVELDKPKPIEQVLTELNIPPTEEAVLTARGLAERGFPVQEPLVWSILPWAEAGWLEEALLALEAKFPLKLEVLTMIRQLRSGNVRDPVLQDARENIPPDLHVLLQRPSVERRSRWGDRFSEGEVFKALARLLVEERFVASLLKQGTYVFAVPFLRQEDLYASWIRITREDRHAGSEEEDTPGSFRLELQIPTEALGLVGVELIVEGKAVTAVLSVEAEPAGMEADFKEFEGELQAAGWKLKTLQVRRWSDAQGSSFTL